MPLHLIPDITFYIDCCTLQGFNLRRFQTSCFNNLVNGHSIFLQRRCHSKYACDLATFVSSCFTTFVAVSLTALVSLLIAVIKSVSFSDGLAFLSGQFFKQETHNLASVFFKKVCKNSFVPAFPDTALDGRTVVTFILLTAWVLWLSV